MQHTPMRRHLPPGAWQAAPAWGAVLVPFRCLAAAVEAWVLLAYALRLVDLALVAHAE